MKTFQCRLSLMREPGMRSWTLGSRGCWAAGTLASRRATRAVQTGIFHKARTQLRWKPVLADVQATLATVGQRLNEVTGYSNIESLKRAVLSKEKEIESLRSEYRAAKDAYTRDVEDRAARQKEANDLLRRRDTWGQEDIRRITELYNQEFNNDRFIERTKRHMEETEQRFDEARVDLIALVSARYHEEQIWSDKIRRASTWGTWALTAVNVVMFFVVQIVLEPWKRSRLVSAFEGCVQTRFDEIKSQLSQRLLSEHARDQSHHDAALAHSDNTPQLPERHAYLFREPYIYATCGLTGMLGGFLLAAWRG